MLWIRELEAVSKPATVRVKLAAARALYAALRWSGATTADPFSDAKPGRDLTPSWEKRQAYSLHEVEWLARVAEGYTLQENIMKLEHVALNIPDPKAAAAWYAENLNFRIVKASDTGPFIHFLADQHGSMLEFYNNPAGAVPDYQAMSPFTLHLAFTVDDINAVHQKLINSGATREGEIQTTAEGDQLVFLRDPWGVMLQLVKRNRPLL